jgi:Heterokaryon incompatibility protein (HET)
MWPIQRKRGRARAHSLHFTHRFPGSPSFDFVIQLPRMSLLQLYPLDCLEGEIRLLTLLPVYFDPSQTARTDFAQWEAAPLADAQNAPITCNLEKISLENKPRYLALLSTWGDAKDLTAIQVNGIVVQVTISLKNALNCLWRERHPVIIWVDTLCINQKNDVEKDAQVEQMCEIYTMATSVIAWLGLLDSNSDLAMDVFNLHGKDLIEASFLNLRKEDYIRWDDPGAREEVIRAKKRVEEHSLKLPYQTYQAVKKFSERSYWTRAWILQEVSVASQESINFICGTKKLSFNRFAAGFLFFHQFRTHVGKSITEEVLNDPLWSQKSLGIAEAIPNPAIGQLIGTRRKSQKETGSPECLMDLLTRGCVVAGPTSYCEVKNRRDKIYALRGFVF